MTAQSNIPLPTTPKRWEEGSYIVYYNHKDNGIQEEGKEGGRYTADYVIVNSLDQEVIDKAIRGSISD